MGSNLYILLVRPHVPSSRIPWINGVVKQPPSRVVQVCMIANWENFGCVLEDMIVPKAISCTASRYESENKEVKEGVATIQIHQVTQLKDFYCLC